MKNEELWWRRWREFEIGTVRWRGIEQIGGDGGNGGGGGGDPSIVG